MQKIYSVIIKGRTLESWDLRELLARAVSTKRKSDSRSVFPDRLEGQPAAQKSSNFYVVAGFADIL